jgi:hypothetical protein
VRHFTFADVSSQAAFGFALAQRHALSPAALSHGLRSFMVKAAAKQSDTPDCPRGASDEALIAPRNI